MKTEPVRKSAMVTAEVGVFVDSLKVIYKVPINSTIDTLGQLAIDLFMSLSEDDRQTLAEALKTGDFSKIRGLF